MPFPTPDEVGWVPQSELGGLGSQTDLDYFALNNPWGIDLSGMDRAQLAEMMQRTYGQGVPVENVPIAAPGQPSQAEINRVNQAQEAFDVQQEGYRRWLESQGQNAILSAAPLLMGLALPAGLAGAGAGAGGAAATPAYTGATTAAGLPTGAAGAAGGGVGALSGAVPAVGAAPGIGAAGALGAGLTLGPNGLPTAATGGAVAGGAAAGGWLDRFLPYIASGGSALLGAYGAGQAADAEEAALQRAIDEQRRQYDTTRQDLMPWMEAGRGALGNLQNAGTAFQTSPGYQWRLNEGQRDIGNSFAARGGAASGNALRALSEYNQGLAGGEFNNWWGQQAQLAGFGQNATTNVSNYGQNTAGNVSNALAGQGVSRGSGIANRYGAIGQGLNNSLNWLWLKRAGYA